MHPDRYGYSREGIFAGTVFLSGAQHLIEIDMKKILTYITLLLTINLFGQYSAPDSVYDDNGKIRDLEFNDSAYLFQLKFNAGLHHINDTLPNMISDSTQAAMSAVQNEIVSIHDSLRADTIRINEIQGLDSDSIYLNATIEFKQGIRITTVTESFSVSKTISFIDQYYAEMTITNNTAITIENIPEGTNPQLALIWSGGDYTASIAGATQMTGNTATLQELDGAVDLVQFKKIDGADYYTIMNVK